MKPQRILIIIAVLSLALLSATYFLFFPKTPQSILSPFIPLNNPSSPFLSPEKKAILSQIQTHEISIKDGLLSHPELTIKQHDQVTWENIDQETYQIEGKDWGNVPIPSEKRFTQAFDQKGTFSYSCSLHPSLHGTITVK